MWHAGWWCEAAEWRSWCVSTISVMDDLLVSCNSNFTPLCCLLQGPPLGQCAGQNNQAEEGELPPERSSPLSGNQRGAGPHHWLLSFQTWNRSDMHIYIFFFYFFIFYFFTSPQILHFLRITSWWACFVLSRWSDRVLWYLEGRGAIHGPGGLPVWYLQADETGERVSAFMCQWPNSETASVLSNWSLCATQVSRGEV